LKTLAPEFGFLQILSRVSDFKNSSPFTVEKDSKDFVEICPITKKKKRNFFKKISTKNFIFRILPSKEIFLVSSSLTNDKYKKATF